MVINETNGTEAGNLVNGQQGIEVPLPLTETDGILDILVPAGEIRAIVIFEDRDIGFIIIGEFTIGAVGDSLPGTKIPDKTILVVGDVPVAF